MRKITATQQDLLERIAQDRIRTNWSPSKGYYAFDTRNAKATFREATIKALFDQNLIILRDPNLGERFDRYEITDAGRTALEGPCDEGSKGCTGTGSYTTDPYDLEVNDRETWQRLCGNCAQARADEA